MKKIIEISKKAYVICSTWISQNGIEGIAGLIAGFALWTVGLKIWAGFSFGVFATRNWDIVKAWILKQLSK